MSYHFRPPQTIRERMRESLEHGNRRVMLAASAGPTTAIDTRIADTIPAFVDAR